MMQRSREGVGFRTVSRQIVGVRLTALIVVLAGEDGGREKFAVLALVKPRALEIEERDAGQVREGERVERQLGERFAGGRLGFVVEDVDRAVANLQEVDMAGDRARLAVRRGGRCFREQLDTPAPLDGGDVLRVEPDVIVARGMSCGGCAAVGRAAALVLASGACGGWIGDAAKLLLHSEDPLRAGRPTERSYDPIQLFC